MVYLASCLNEAEIGKEFERDAEKLKAAIQEHCWDERDGFFYSVDLNLLPVTEQACRELLCLPMHPGLEPADVDAVCRQIADWDAARR